MARKKIRVRIDDILKIDLARQERWVNASGVIPVDSFTATIHPGLPGMIQQLGRIDSQIVWSEQRTSKDVAAALERDPLVLTDQLSLAWLWVLGGYELVRTMSQWCGEHDTTEARRKSVNAVKQRFARIRMLLSKLEPQQKHKRTDFASAMPAGHVERGTAWQVSDDTYVVRRDLSDAFLELLEDINGTAKIGR